LEYDHEQRAKWERERQACATPVKLTIETRVPSKWRFVDLETGAVWERVPKLKDSGKPGFVRSSIPRIFACDYVEDHEAVGDDS
jgi:hypothetical protein